MHLAHILPLLIGLLAIFAPEPINAEPSFESIARKGTTERVTTADVAEFAEAKHRRRRDLDDTARELLDLIPPYDRSRILQCGKSVLRFTHEARGYDLLVLRRCGNFYCPWCPTDEHAKRMLYQARKLASLSPDHELRVTSIVWSLPQPLQQFVREHEGAIPEWRRAIRRTLARAYGYKARHGVHLEDAAWNELGAIMNHHAFGDKAEPWPKSQPHVDMLLAAYRRRDGKLEPMPAKWPELYQHTNHHYRRELRACLTPIAQRFDAHDIVRFLKTDFETDWRVSTTETGSIVHIERALHKVRYSCRPLFNMSHARLKHTTSGMPLLQYRSHYDEDRATVIHTIPARPAFAQLDSLRSFMEGRLARTHAGILSKRAYRDTVALHGHEPVQERPKRGLKLKQAWTQNDSGVYEELKDPRLVLS